MENGSPFDSLIVKHARGHGDLTKTHHHCTEY